MSNHFRSRSALASLVFGVVSIPALADTHGSEHVVVSNTPANPVPISGTVNATIANPSLNVSGTVNANVLGTVPINGVVNITNPSLGVSNTPGNPLYIDSGNDARHGMASFCDANIDPSVRTTACELAIVPAGQILVIESVFCTATIPTNRPFSVVVMTYGAPNPIFPGAGNLATVNHFLPMTPYPNGNYGDITYYSFASPVKLYAFGPSLGTAATTSVGVNVQIGPFTMGSTMPQFGCSIAGRYESQ